MEALDVQCRTRWTAVLLLVLLAAAQRPCLSRGLTQDDVADASATPFNGEDAAIAVPATSDIPNNSTIYAGAPTDGTTDANDVGSQLEAAPAWSCDNELQVVLCAAIPLGSEGFTACCESYSNQTSDLVGFQTTTAPPAGAEDPGSEAPDPEVANVPITRTDVAPDGPLSRPPPYAYRANCLQVAQAGVPNFAAGSNGSPWYQPVPRLTRMVINRIKSEALRVLQNQASTASLVALITSMRRFNPSSGFVHPALHAGPSELALLRWRLTNNDPVASRARTSLLTGGGVPVKWYMAGTARWSPFTNTPLSYPGPYVVRIFRAGEGGRNAAGATCPVNYPAVPAVSECCHISFVELDGVQAFRQAMAYWVTDDTRYADNALRILAGWAQGNREWGMQGLNGPLAGGWGVAAMAKALELLRYKPWAGYRAEVYSQFVSWVNALVKPQMMFYAGQMTDHARRVGNTNFYSNWHATLADALMSLALLTDDVDLYQRAKAIFRDTVDDYLKWGKGAWAAGRLLGETSETMRDIYHTEFGLGGLIQVAEAAWQQGEDLYDANGYALVAAMELHARILSATRDPSLLPPNFRPFQQMPRPPAGATWRFELRTQLWAAYNVQTGARVSELRDGIKYVVGPWELPTGWEVAYNHYVGRLGMRMPETAKFLARRWPDYYEFHWGQGTLTHAASASLLWRPGVKDYAMCS